MYQSNVNSKYKLEFARYLKDSKNDNFAVHHSKLHHVRPHYHSFIELMYVKSGTMKHLYNGEVQQLRANDYIFLNNSDSHSYQGSEDIHVVNVIFVPASFDVALSDNNDLRHILNLYLGSEIDEIVFQNITGTPFYDDDDHVLKVIEQIEKENVENAFAKNKIISGLVMDVIIRIIRRSPNLLITEVSAVTESMIKYIHDHIYENISLSSMGHELGYCPQHLSRCFKRDMHTNPIDYIHTKKIQRACKLLLSKKATANELTAMLGYKDEKYFGRLFRKYTGYSPKAFSLRNKKDISL